MALRLFQFAQRADLLEKLFQVAAAFLQQSAEARYQVVIGGNGVELGIVQWFGEPVVVAPDAAPFDSQLRIVFAQLRDDPFSLFPKPGGILAVGGSFVGSPVGGVLFAVKKLQLLASTHDE